MDRARLDTTTGDRPTAIWQRSCHEWFLNSAAIDALGITAENMAGKGPVMVLADDPHDVDPRDLGKVRVLGTIFDGGWFSVPVEHPEQRLRAPGSEVSRTKTAHGTGHDHGCGCVVAEFLAGHIAANGFAA